MRPLPSHQSDPGSHRLARPPIEDRSACEPQAPGSETAAASAYTASKRKRRVGLNDSEKAVVHGAWRAGTLGPPSPFHSVDEMPAAYRLAWEAREDERAHTAELTAGAERDRAVAFYQDLVEDAA